jgi:hypothetical protein
MSQEDFSEKKTDNRRRRLLFALGGVIGLLLGALLTMLVVNWLDYGHPTVVKIMEPTLEGKSDTVVNYVIHKYQTEKASENNPLSSDTLAADSVMSDELDYQDFMLDDDELRELQETEEAHQNIVGERMLRKSVQKVIYLNHNKQEIPMPSNGIAQIQIQQWETPIKNRLSYQFSGNTVKLKGLSAENAKVVCYEDNFYLAIGKRVYALKPNKQYEKLIEVSDVVFPLK